MTSNVRTPVIFCIYGILGVSGMNCCCLDRTCWRVVPGWRGAWGEVCGEE